MLLCKKVMGKEGRTRIKILECRGMDNLAVIPEQIAGFAVTEAAPYLFSACKNYEEETDDTLFWWSNEEGSITEEDAALLPPLRGECLQEIRLPSSLEKVGPYAFYNCDKIKKIELYSTTLDWGAGVFTGCSGIKEFIFHVEESKKSCMKEVLAELRQTLFVTYFGQGKAKLIFSEFFEEAVENTPARILVTNTHGCGKQYRNAFVNTQFQFQEYDSLFPYVTVQEPEKLVVQMALDRILYPYQLLDCYRDSYLEYLKEHKLAAVCQAIEKQEMEALQWLMNYMDFEPEEMETAIETALAMRDQTSVSFLMDQKRKMGKMRRRRFCL